MRGCGRGWWQCRDSGLGAQGEAGGSPGRVKWVGRALRVICGSGRHCDVPPSSVCQQNVPKLVTQLRSAWVSSPKIFHAGVFPQQRGVSQTPTSLGG